MKQNVKEKPHYPGTEKEERMLYNLANRSRGVKRLPEIIPQRQIWDSPPELLITSRFPFPSLGCVPRGMSEFSSLSSKGDPDRRNLLVLWSTFLYPFTSSGSILDFCLVCEEAASFPPIFLMTWCSECWVSISVSHSSAYMSLPVTRCYFV